jgi:hypothetical protein
VTGDQLKALRCIANGAPVPNPKPIAEAAVREIEKLRREREDLRMFCKGMARNIEEMLK